MWGHCENNLVLAKFRESPLRAQNRACEVTLALVPLSSISNEPKGDTQEASPVNGSRSQFQVLRVTKRGGR